MKLFLRKYWAAMVLYLAATLPVAAQSTTDLQAIALYNKAELAFNNTAYEEALDYIKEAEELLGRSNSKILYLKIQTLDLLFKIDMKRAQPLEQAIAKFYSITNRNNYPQEKYMRVATIELELQERLAAEKSDFEKLKSSDEVSEYETFFSNYPGSSYEAQLKSGYNNALEKQKLIQQKVFEQNWKTKNLPLIKNYTRKGTAEVVTGAMLFSLGSAAAILGGLNYATKNGEEIIPKYNWTYYEHIDLYVKENDTHFKEVFFISSVSIGAAAALTGVILMPIGARHFKLAKKLRKEGRNQNIEISFVPELNPQLNNVGMGLNLKF